MNYQIGQYYHYPNDDQKYKLIEVQDWVFIFECGRRCTDSVFMDMFNCETGIQVYKDTQLKLF
jgi:hypothetical protein